jgi:hypothetical protein
MTAKQQFDEWYGSVGIRSYSKHHGSAEGHEEYMAIDWMSGYHSALKDMQEIIKNDTSKADNSR